MELQGSL
jgi:hypothetical protein